MPWIWRGGRFGGRAGIFAEEPGSSLPAALDIAPASTTAELPPEETQDTDLLGQSARPLARVSVNLSEMLAVTTRAPSGSK
jgi:hypothetical protein